MPTLPQLIEEDITSIEATILRLLDDSEATSGIIIDKGGFHIASHGNTAGIDTTTLAALASASFAATQHIATLVEEDDFNCVYQQGEAQSILIRNIDEYSLLVVVFSAEVGVGAVKYYAEKAVADIAYQFQVAHDRNPEEGFDLSMMNLADTSGVFRRKD